MTDNPLVAAWRRLPIGVRYGAEAALTRVLVVAAMALLTYRVLVAEGYMDALRARAAGVEIPFIDASFKITTHTLPIDQAVVSLVVVLVGAATFSPWRAPSMLMGLVTTAILWVAYPYIRLSTNFLRALPLFGGLFPDFASKDPPLLTTFLVAAAMAVVAGFAIAEGSRLLRRAYEERGVPPTELRSLGRLQAAAGAAVAGAALVVALALAAALSLVRAPLRDLPVPRVNPVLAFLIMAIFLGLAIVAFAWKPAPAEAPSSATEVLKKNLQRAPKEQP